MPGIPLSYRLSLALCCSVQSTQLKHASTYHSLNHTCSHIRHELYIIGRNRFSTSDFAYSSTFLHTVVCLSVVCHIRPPYLNRSTDLDVIWKVHFVGHNDTLC